MTKRYTVDFCKLRSENFDNIVYGGELRVRVHTVSHFQLRHVFTGKYLHVNATQTSWTETSNMMVELNPVNRKTSLFRILPRFKVKAEGEIVRLCYYNIAVLQ